MQRRVHSSLTFQGSAYEISAPNFALEESLFLCENLSELRGYQVLTVMHSARNVLEVWDHW